MSEKTQLIEDWLTQRWSKQQLAMKYGVSRPTLNKWIDRFKRDGYSGLSALSRRPHTSPNATPLWQQEQILEVKRTYSGWGPKKIRDFLVRHHQQHNWPADSTVGEILKRHGLVQSRTRTKRVSTYPNHLTRSEYPCQIWNIDFKGEGVLGNGTKCYPLTLSDDYSRYLLCCQGLAGTRREPVKACLETVFREHGLPDVIKSDNGVPFASRSIGGLSRLSIWLIQHGILPERIDKGKPTQNGRHERLHRTLKAETMLPLKHSMPAQQRRFDQFRYEFNEQRSHEGLGRKTPASVFRASRTQYVEKTRPIEYAIDFSVRKVKRGGEIKWQGKFWYIGQLLAGESIGLRPISDGRLEIYYSFLPIGYLNEVKSRIEPIRPNR